MMKSYDSFSDWRADQSDENQELIDALGSIIETTAPHLTTTVKWGQGCWADGKDHRVYIHCADDHVQLGFYNGSSLDDPLGLLSGNGKYIRFVRVHSTNEVQPEAFAALITQAIQ
ncbi:MAG: DUF1801 domain-containing protein [Candidatus Nanopelagicales bacterium]